MLQRLELLSLRSDKVLLLEWLLSCSVDPAPSSSGTFSCIAPPPTVWKMSSQGSAIHILTRQYLANWVLSGSLPLGFCECCRTREGMHNLINVSTCSATDPHPPPRVCLVSKYSDDRQLHRVLYAVHRQWRQAWTLKPLLTNFLINQIILPQLSDFNRKTTKLFQGRGLWNPVS